MTVTTNNPHLNHELRDCACSTDIDTENFSWSFVRSNGEVVVYHTTKLGNEDKIVRNSGEEITDSESILAFIDELDNDFDRWWEQEAEIRETLMRIQRELERKEWHEELNDRAYNDYGRG